MDNQTRAGFFGLMELFWNSFQIAAATTIVAAFLAFIAARIRFSVPRGVRTALDILFLLPLVLPSAMAATHSLSLYVSGSESSVLAMADTISALPLFYLCGFFGFRRVDKEASDAARMQGLGNCGIFWRVWFPVAWRWLVLGLILGLIRAALLSVLIAFS